MSLQFNDTENFRGLVQIYEKETGLSISGNTTKLKKFAADVNLALDDFITAAIEVDGKWQIDDTNHEDNHPIIYTNLVDGRRDYPFITDESGNAILDVFRVFVRSQTDGPYEEIFPVDQQSDPNVQGLTDEQNTEGTPYQYDKTGNVIFLDPIPSSNITRGLKVLINREASYFSYDATTKKPGVPGIFHRYFAIKPAYDYARRNNLSNKKDLEDEVIKYEGSEERNVTGLIKKYFGVRERDTVPVLRSKEVPFM